MEDTTKVAVASGVKRLSNEQAKLLASILGEDAVKKLQEQNLLPTKDGPTAERVTEAKRQTILRELVGMPDEDTHDKAINIVHLLDAGFPDSAASAPYWSGIAGGSMVAWALGWVSALKLHRVRKNLKLQDVFRLDLDLRDIKPADVEKRKAMWLKAGNKTPFPYPPGFTPPVEVTPPVPEAPVNGADESLPKEPGEDETNEE